MESKSFHNTTDEEPEVVRDRVQQTQTQEEIVMGLMNKYIKLSASMVWERYPNHNSIPITSIRRALSNLAFDKKLVKLKEKRTGIYGKPETFYSLPLGQQKLF